ncbi:unnamed protein product [Polarella glacialis]|uniref:C3H1-type domain-containing protein n=1 Tax=Polarella glacialis TaxID=89957 RepID=A0A813EXC3_POLGL|nr:unnamed protein product [Polarella glacialis]
MANTFSHVRSQDPDAFVARRSASSPPKIIKVISSSKQQESEAVRPETNQGGVASAEHVGLESPGRSSTQQEQQQQHQHQQQQNQLQKVQAHQSGQCRPCSFHLFKADSCRLGDDCQYCHLCTYQDFMQKKKAGKHDGRKRLRGKKRLLLKAQCSEQQGGESSNPDALQTWATEKPRSLPLAPPGARFLTTWPSAWLSTIAEEVQPQIIAEKVHPRRYL